MMGERINVALIGAGLMGSFHAETLAWRLPGARLAAIADPDEEAVGKVLAVLGREDIVYESDLERVLANSEIQAVAIVTPGRTHPELIQAAAEAGKAIFCEKPLGHSLDEADRALAAVSRRRTILQLGFQRRFDAGYQRVRRLVEQSTLGEVHLLRSNTRDPAVPPGGMVPWAIFLETLIHDFDALRWLAGSEAIELQAMADALVWPKGRPGMVDTAMVTIRFANGAMAVADASFQSAYGYDVRAEVFGSGGMATVGDGRVDAAMHYGPDGVSRPQVYWFKDLFGAAFVAEMEHFIECVRGGRQPSVSGLDGHASLAIAQAAIESAQTGRAVTFKRSKPRV
jgi:myo-inositol 2-dehydrogenase/D-chiro-inositol 1-dehydrogenase